MMNAYTRTMETDRKAADVAPGAYVMVAVSDTGDVMILQRLLERGVALAHKPFTAESLGQKVREVLDAK